MQLQQACFNDRASILAACSPAGFQLYSIPPSQGFRRLSVVTLLGGASFLSILDETPLVAMVGSNADNASSGAQGTNRLLQVYDSSRKEVISSLFFDSAILNVRMNPKRLVVIRERQTHIFDLNTMAPQSQIATTSPPNRFGLGVLSPLTEGGTCYYCYPFTSRSKLPRKEGAMEGAEGGEDADGAAMSSCPGDVVVLEAVSNETLQPFKAHDHPLSALAMSGDGSRVVTASTSGTLIRVFNLQGLLLYQFRRGQRKAFITHLAVNFNGQIVSVCSDTGTLHLFRCESGHGERFTSLVRRDIRSFAKHNLPAGYRPVCSINPDGTVLSLVAIPCEGSSPDARATFNKYTIEQNRIQDSGNFPLVFL